MFQNSREAVCLNLEGGERNGGLGQRNGARPLRALGRERKIKNGPGPEHVGA